MIARGKIIGWSAGVFMLLVASVTNGAETSRELEKRTEKSVASASRVYRVDRSTEVRPGVVVFKRAEEAGIGKAAASLDRTLAKIGSGTVPVFATAREDAAGLSRIHRVRLVPGVDAFEAAEQLMREPGVVWAEPAYRLDAMYDPDDPLRGFQWHLHSIDVHAAWDIAGTDDNDGVVIGIVDSGVDLLHEDLADNIWVNPGETARDRVDDDGNGYVDDVNGWDFGAGDDDPSPEPVTNTAVADKDRWHGTSVAGTASAVTDNGYGIAAPAFNAVIMPVKVLSEDGVFWSDVVAAGVVYAADNGADIINLSLGGGASNIKAEAVAYATAAGALVVASAGNDNQNSPRYPASYREVMSVAATDVNDFKAGFSNWHRSVDVSAPGDDVYTIWAGGFEGKNGTSFSAPLTSGVAALVKKMHPDWTGRQVGEQVRITAEPLDAWNPAYAGGLGRGRVNARFALGTVSPSIRLSSYELVEGETSNGNGLFERGEDIDLAFRFQNFLEAASGVRVTLTPDHADITTSVDPVFLGDMGMLVEAGNTGDPVVLHIAGDATQDREVTIVLTITADGGYEDTDYLSITPLPSYANITGGNVSMTVSAFGRLGSPDIDRGLGDGFVFGGTENLLFEGAAMAAVSPDSVSDVARRPGTGQNQDFRIAEGGDLMILKPGPQSDEEIRSAFSDAGSFRSLGLGATQRALAFTDPPDDDYILVAYQLYKVDDRPLSGLYFGLFMDWDVGDNGGSASTNRPLFDATADLGIVYDPISSLYGGLAVVSDGGAGSYKSVDNKVELFDADEYTDAEKWAHLSGGVRPPESTTPSDYSHVVGVGPLDLAPGDTALVGFAVLGGTSYSEVSAVAAAAKAKWNALYGESDVMGGTVYPTTYHLGDNFPNPFNPSTRIGYSLPESGRVTLTVYDMMGREVARLVDGVKEAGDHHADWDGTDASGRVPSGVYFYELRTGGFRALKKMILLR